MSTNDNFPGNSFDVVTKRHRHQFLNDILTRMCCSSFFSTVARTVPKLTFGGRD